MEGDHVAAKNRAGHLLRSSRFVSGAFRLDKRRHVFVEQDRGRHVGDSGELPQEEAMSAAGNNGNQNL